MLGAIAGSELGREAGPKNASLFEPLKHGAMCRLRSAGPYPDCGIPIADSPARSPRNVSNSLAYDLLYLITKHAVAR